MKFIGHFHENYQGFILFIYLFFLFICLFIYLIILLSREKKYIDAGLSSNIVGKTNQLLVLATLIVAHERK